ncbi:MAG: hypothetical protein ACTSP4_08740 [Candidatus Hodarchaeales archaeon]
MQIFPIGAESLGTRSFSFFIATEDTKIIIDPSVSLGPFRSGYKPHVSEIAASFITRKAIQHLAKSTDIIIQTHYHADHLTLGIRRIYDFTDEQTALDLYKNKIILAKDLNSISYNQRKRAYWLWNRKDVSIQVADGTEFIKGNTKIIFSAPVPHGSAGTKMGKVIQVVLHDMNTDESCLFTSDVNGPGTDLAMNFITKQHPSMCFIDGPSIYHPSVTDHELQEAAARLCLLLEEVPQLIVDHHFPRDLHYEEWWNEHVGGEVTCIADYLGFSAELLEARRKNNHLENPCPGDFYQGLINGDSRVLEQLSKEARKLSFYHYNRKLCHYSVKQSS